MMEIDLTADRSIKATVTPAQKDVKPAGAYHFAERRDDATVGLAGANTSQFGNSLFVTKIAHTRSDSDFRF